MDYRFQCPKCGTEQTISMPLKDYHSDGHYCSVCNSELQRSIFDFASGAIWKTDGSYAGTN